jgi:cell shape-determining protein MreD
MKRFFVLLFVNLILALLQLSFFGKAFGSGSTPNLVLALAFALTLAGLGGAGKMSAFLGGLMLDLLGFNIIGISSIVLVGSMIMYDFVRKNVSRNLVMNAISVFLSTMIYDKLLGSSVGIFGSIMTLVFCGIFYLLVENASGYFLRSGYKISDEK